MGKPPSETSGKWSSLVRICVGSAKRRVVCRSRNARPHLRQHRHLHRRLSSPLRQKPASIREKALEERRCFLLALRWRNNQFSFWLRIINKLMGKTEESAKRLLLPPLCIA